MKVQLQTRAGELVAERGIPPFNPPPDILYWGIRHFVIVPATVTDDGALVYREAHGWWISDQIKQPHSLAANTTPEDGISLQNQSVTCQNPRYAKFSMPVIEPGGRSFDLMNPTGDLTRECSTCGQPPLAGCPNAGCPYV